jgi:hypothetical protein
LRRTGQSCLVRSIVVQAWDAAHGHRRDLIIGVTGRTEFRAHAWLDGDRVPSPLEADLDLEAVGVGGAGESNAPAAIGASDHPGFHELLRRPAPAADGGSIRER